MAGKNNTVNQPSRSNQEYITVNGVKKRNLAYDGKKGGAHKGHKDVSQPTVPGDFVSSFTPVDSQDVDPWVMDAVVESCTPMIKDNYHLFDEAFMHSKELYESEVSEIHEEFEIHEMWAGNNRKPGEEYDEEIALAVANRDESLELLHADEDTRGFLEENSKRERILGEVRGLVRDSYDKRLFEDPEFLDSCFSNDAESEVDSTVSSLVSREYVQCLEDETGVSVFEVQYDDYYPSQVIYAVDTRHANADVDYADRLCKASDDRMGTSSEGRYFFVKHGDEVDHAIECRGGAYTAATNTGFTMRGTESTTAGEAERKFQEIREQHEAEARRIFG